jgi:hypothetical protein
MCRSRKPVYRQRYRGFESLPLRCKTLVFPGLLAFLANCFGFPACPRVSMPAGAASSCALSWNLLSRQSRLRTLVFPGETGGFAAERKNRVISVRRFEFFQPIAVLAAARYCGAATTYSLLSPKISKAASRKVPKRAHLHHAQWDRKNSAISGFPTWPAVVFSTRSTSSSSLAFKFSLLISKNINAASKPTRLFPSTNG